MSSANLDLVRSIYAAWERGDFGSAEWAHPDIEFVIADGPTRGSWSGVAGMAESARAGLSTWKALRIDAEEYRELGDERVIVLHHYSGRGKTSGLDLAQMRSEGASLFQLRDGKVTRLIRYYDRDRALADLGLTPDTGLMASANLDLVRSILAANERGDYNSTEWAHPDIEFVVADGPSPSRWTGLAGMTEGWLDMANAWEGLRSAADEYRELDDGRVLVLNRRSGRGKISGLELGEIGSEGAAVFHILGGKVTKLVVYWSREHALADLCLAPDTGS